MKFPKIDFNSWFYKNCKKQRRREAKICQVCPFRSGIEKQEKEQESNKACMSHPSKDNVLSEIQRNPGLHADEVAERLGMPTKVVIDLIGELIEEGVVEYLDGT